MFFDYVNQTARRDQIRVDVNVLLNKTADQINESKGFLIPSIEELYAPKIVALLTRGAPRDLFDIRTMIDNVQVDRKRLMELFTLHYAFAGKYHLSNQDLDFQSIDAIGIKKFLPS
jgi:predicted nucleotidyltransferase component of viral defense system